MSDQLFPLATDAVLRSRLHSPEPEVQSKPSTWSVTAEIIAAPFKGVAQGGLQSARVGSQVLPMQAGNPLAMTASEQEDVLREGGVSRSGQDEALRRTIDALKPDPLASTTASVILQDVSRLLSKVAGYSIMGGVPLAIGGTGADEAVTGYLELRDRGVDPATAAKVGAVRGTSTAVGVALPVVGKTALQTAGLVLAGGPASFMAEQAVTRKILNDANYPDLAREHDPFDPVGLGVSLAVPGVIGAAVHRARARAASRAATSDAAPPQAIQPDLIDAATADQVAAMARSKDIVDAAHVSLRNQALDANMLADQGNLATLDSHVRTMEAAARAMDDGQPVHITDLALDPAKAQRVEAELAQRLRQVDDELAAARQAEGPVASLDSARSLDDLPPTGALDVAGLMTRAADVIRTHGAVPDGPAAAALSPDLRNMTSAIYEFSDRLPELTRQIRAVEWESGNRTLPADAIAQAAQRLRSGQLSQVLDTPLARADQVARQRPDMPVRMDEDGPARPAMDLVREARDESRGDKTDSRAYMAAVECFLRF